jgi:hypothetical protein
MYFGNQLAITNLKLFWFGFWTEKSFLDQEAVLSVPCRILPKH